MAKLADAPDLKPYIAFFFLPLKFNALSLKPLSGMGFSAALLQLTTTHYNSFLVSSGRKSGKKVQNAWCAIWDGPLPVDGRSVPLRFAIMQRLRVIEKYVFKIQREC